jgi:hypothetical protein
VELEVLKKISYAMGKHFTKGKKIIGLIPKTK